MTAHILRRTLWAERRALVGWILGLVLLVVITAGSWPAIEGSSGELEQLLGDLPPPLTALFGEGITSFSAAAVVGSRLFGSIGLLLVVGYAVSRGARAIAGEETDGTMELLVTQPVSRTRIATEKLLATWLALAGLVLVLQVVLLALQPAVGLGFAVSTVVQAATGLYLLAALFGMLAFAVGAATGVRATAVAVAGGVAVGLFLLAGLGQLVPALEGVAGWSPFSRYDGSVVLVRGIDASAVLLFGVVAVGMAAVGVVAFERRDLR